MKDLLKIIKYSFLLHVARTLKFMKTWIYSQRIVKMNKTEDDELGSDELTDEEIRALSEGECPFVFSSMCNLCKVSFFPFGNS